MNIGVLPLLENVAIRVRNEADALAATGHKVKIFNWNRGGPLEEISSELAFEEGVELKRIRAEAEGGLSFVFGLLRFYIKLAEKLEKEKIDVFHCCHPFLLPISLLFAKEKKVVYDSREMYSFGLSEHYFPGVLSGVARKIIEFFEDMMVKRVDYVLTVDTVKDKLEKRYREVNDNVEVIYNVPKLRDLPKEEDVEEIREKYKDKNVLIYVGGIMRRKGAIKNLEVVNMLKDNFDLSLLLVGHFKDSEKEALEYIKENNFEEIVDHKGYLPFEEMLRYLKIADIGLALHQPTKFYQIYPSKGTGRKFFTYMQASLPIVGPEFGEVGQVVREENCGVLVDTTETREIAKSITNLLNGQEKAEEMGKLGRKAIEEKYNWEKEKNKLLRAYQNIQ